MNPQAADKRKFPIHVGTVNIVFEEETVTAKQILEEAGAKPAEDFILEALDRPAGKVVAEFSSNDAVKFTDDDRKFFRALPRGGGRS